MKNLAAIFLATMFVCVSNAVADTWATFDLPTEFDNGYSYPCTEARGISGNNVVGTYYDGTYWQGFLYNGSTWTSV